MSSVAILSCQPNSHPFQERHISLHEPVKIGRSVARARPASNNGIFDCKVLSRNHAVIWYENSKFYLQDTKSSNGTFINTQRLSRGGEESPAREVFSGDQIQFGVDVMDNNKRGEKITHNCIIATVTLFHPDGREAKNIYSESGQFSNTVTPGVTIQSQELYQLAQYLQEALHREKMLEQKLTTLQQLVDNTQEASENGWQALIDEDRLLSRLEVLENQLHIYSKNHAEDTLRQEVVTLQEEKNTYETTAKESLKRVLQEKLEAVRKLSDLERSLHNTEDECSHLKEMCEHAQEELQQLAEKYQDQQKEVIEIQEKLQEAEKEHKEEVEKIKQEKQELNEKLQEMIRQETVLSAKMESLQADNDIAVEQLAAMKDKLESIKEPKIHLIDDKSDEEEDDKIVKSEEESDEKIVNSDEDSDNVKSEEKVLKINHDNILKKDDDNNIIIEDGHKIITDDENDNRIEDLHREADNNKIPNHIDEVDTTRTLSLEKIDIDDIQAKLKESQKQIEKYKVLIQESDVKLQESNKRLETIQKELERAELDRKQYITQITSLEEKLKLSDLHMNLMMENTMADLKQQLKESHHQNDNSSELITDLQEKVKRLESDLVHTPVVEKMEATLVAATASKPTINHLDDSDSGLEDDDSLKELLREARILQNRAEEELRKCKDELDESKSEVIKKGEETVSLKDQLSQAQKYATDQSMMVLDLQEQLKKAETTTKEVKQQILDLRDQLLEEQTLAKERQEEIHNLKCQLDQERSKNKEIQKDLEESKSKYLDSQLTAKQSHNEAEQLKNKVRHLQEKLDADRRSSHHGSSRMSHDSHHGSHRDLHSTHSGGHTPSSPSPKHRGEFTALKDECSGLRKRIQAIEADMKMSRKENLQLSAEYNKLQESYKQLEALKEKLEMKETTWQSNLTDSQKETEQTRQELQEANEELANLRVKCDDYAEKIGQLKVEVSTLTVDYKQLSDRSKILSFLSSIPLLMLLFAILMALYPTLAQITATSV